MEKLPAIFHQKVIADHDARGNVGAKHRLPKSLVLWSMSASPLTARMPTVLSHPWYPRTN